MLQIALHKQEYFTTYNASFIYILKKRILHSVQIKLMLNAVCCKKKEAIAVSSLRVVLLSVGSQGSPLNTVTRGTDNVPSNFLARHEEKITDVQKYNFSAQNL